MKTLHVRTILVGSLTAILGCDRGPSEQSTPTTQPDAVSVTEPVTQPFLANQVRLEHVGEEWDAYGNFLTVLRLTNRSQHDIAYAGYTTSSPAYMEQVRGSDSEGWRDNGPGWCGVGLGMRQLRAGQSATFTVLAPRGAQSWRIGITIKDPAAHVVWTEPIAANAEKVRDASSAVELVQTTVVRHPDREFPYTFTLKNISDKPLYYGGFQERDVPPNYVTQENRSGSWQDDNGVIWSGTDFGFKQLPPGSTISFSIPAQSLDSTWRIGIRLFKTARPVSYDDAYSSVWWEPQPPRNQG